MTRIVHFPTCSADYPEKSALPEEPQITRIDIGDGEVVWQCVDCGAFVLEQAPAP